MFRFLGAFLFIFVLLSHFAGSFSGPARPLHREGQEAIMYINIVLKGVYNRSPVPETVNLVRSWFGAHCRSRA